MKHICINGWTKKRMIKTVQDKMLDERAVNEKGACLYRGPNGTKCAVGIFIPDDKYKSILETNSPGYTTWSTEFLELGLDKVLPLEAQAISQMQEVHDSFSTDENVKSNVIDWIEQNVA